MGRPEKQQSQTNNHHASETWNWISQDSSLSLSHDHSDGIRETAGKQETKNVLWERSQKRIFKVDEVW